MQESIDPFVHLPALREKVVAPAESGHRNLDLAMLDEKMRQFGAASDWRHSNEFREMSRQKTLLNRWHDDLWVFAYGSLMWNPAFYFREVRCATVSGFQRKFCLKSELGRGTPERPGLMAGLDVGGACHGLVFRVARADLEEETRIIWRREMLLHAYRPVFLPAATDQGPVEALAFVVDRSADRYLADLSVEQAARYVATGSGVLGSTLGYVERLTDQFAVLGIEDAGLLASDRQG